MSLDTSILGGWRLGKTSTSSLEITMEKPKKLTKKQRLELLKQKRAAKAYCDELASRNEFDYGNCWDYACGFGRGWEVDEIYNYLRRYC